MGAAATQRGDCLVRRQCAESDRPAEFQMMDDLNSMPKYHSAGTPFGPILFASYRGVWVAECPKTGFGYFYKTLREAVRSWQVTIVGYDGRQWFAMPTNSDRIKTASLPTTAGE